MNKPTSYTDKQMIQTLSNNGDSIRTIANALGFSKSVVHKVIHQDIQPSEYPDQIGTGCYTTSVHNGTQEELVPVDYESDLSIGQSGQLTKLDSGYPDIYYNEQSKQWEVWKGHKRIWRASTLVKACKVRLSKGKLSKSQQSLLQSVLDASPELQEALNSPPV